MSGVRGRDDGFASVVVLALACVVVLVATVLVALGAVAVDRSRAASAADLAALAAAGSAVQGEPYACALAGRTASAAGAVLSRCALVADEAQVEVEVRPDGALGRLGTARAQSRAGPATRPGVPVVR